MCARSLERSQARDLVVGSAGCLLMPHAADALEVLVLHLIDTTRPRRWNTLKNEKEGFRKSKTLGTDNRRTR